MALSVVNNLAAIAKDIEADWVAAGAFGRGDLPAGAFGHATQVSRGATRQ